MAHVHILLMDLAAQDHAARERELLPQLRSEEQARYRSFSGAGRRRSWLAGRTLLLAALTRVTGSAAPDSLYTDAAGAVRQTGGVLQLNLSHSGDLVAAALAEAPVGIDVEWPKHRTSVQQPDRVFSTAEAAYIAGLPEAARQDAFYLFWTLKESACKAVGLRLWQGLRYACFDPAQGRADLAPPFPAGPWRCMHGRLVDGCHLAVTLGAAAVEYSCERWDGDTWSTEVLRDVTLLKDA